MLRKLLACGANRSLTDDGLTALGIYRTTISDQAAVFADAGLQRLPTLTFEVEGLLMPSHGPTDADEAAYMSLLGQFENREAFYGAG
jgi:hypothetical protein